MSIGNSTAKVVEAFLSSGIEPEQGYKACASLTKLGDHTVITVWRMPALKYGSLPVRHPSASLVPC